jgi:ATP-binding cassette, subfamily B, bacterial MsbA
LPLIPARLDPRIAEALRSQKRLLVAGLVCSAGAAALTGATVHLIGRTVQAVQDRDQAGLTALAAIVVGVFFLRYLLMRGQMLLLSQAANRLTASLRVRLFQKLQRLPVSYFGEKRAGGIQSVLTNDVNVFQSAITGIRDAVDGPLKILVGTVAVFVIQWQLALVSVALFPVMAWVIQRNAKKMKAAQAEAQQDLADLAATTQEQIQGMRLVKAFGAESRVLSAVQELTERSFGSQMKAARRTATLKPLVEFIGAVALAATLVVCGLLVARDMLTVPNLVAFMYALDLINQGFRSVGAISQTFAQVRAAADRIHGEVLDAPETIEDSPQARRLPSVSGRIEFRNVSFAYPDGTQALRNVSFTIEPGTSLALVGPSGAGKSTIADLLLRFYDPTEGQVLFDGVDVRELDGTWYRHQIGVVPQQTFLFAGTISDNLRLGAPEATDDELREAARAANALKFVEETPNGFETVLGERGVRLSGGEGQRLAIARALARNPRVLLLDEATSNLDAVSEQVVTEALESAMRSRTTLFIAHRLTTAARADRILVLRRGEVLETGTHADLMRQEGAYAGMYRAFVSGVLDDSVD